MPWMSGVGSNSSQPRTAALGTKRTLAAGGGELRQPAFIAAIPPSPRARHKCITQFRSGGGLLWVDRITSRANPLTARGSRPYFPGEIALIVGFKEI